MTTKPLYQIHLPYTTFGIEVEPTDGRIWRCAPIAMWAAGKLWVGVRDYYIRKGARITRVT